MIMEIRIVSSYLVANINHILNHRLDAPPDKDKIESNCSPYPTSLPSHTAPKLLSLSAHTSQFIHIFLLLLENCVDYLVVAL